MRDDDRPRLAGRARGELKKGRARGIRQRPGRGAPPLDRQLLHGQKSAHPRTALFAPQPRRRGCFADGQFRSNELETSPHRLGGQVGADGHRHAAGQLHGVQQTDEIEPGGQKKGTAISGGQPVCDQVPRQPLHIVPECGVGDGVAVRGEGEPVAMVSGGREEGFRRRVGLSHRGSAPTVPHRGLCYSLSSSCRKCRSHSRTARIWRGHELGGAISTAYPHSSSRTSGVSVLACRSLWHWHARPSPIAGRSP